MTKSKPDQFGDLIDIDKIEIVARLRTLDPEKVDVLAESMEHQGQLHPIVTRAVEGGSEFQLVIGLHRLKAAMKLGWTQIRATAHAKMSDDEADLAEIDENLIRAELPPAERANHIGLRKAIYERQFPENKHGAAPGKAGGGKKAKGVKSTSFAKATAKATGQSKSTVEKDARRAKVLGELLDRINGSCLDTGAEMDALAKLPEAEQEDLVARAANGERVSAKEVLAAKRSGAKSEPARAAGSAEVDTEARKAATAVLDDDDGSIPPERPEPPSDEPTTPAASDEIDGFEVTEHMAEDSAKLLRKFGTTQPLKARQKFFENVATLLDVEVPDTDQIVSDFFGETYEDLTGVAREIIERYGRDWAEGIHDELESEIENYDEAVAQSEDDDEEGAVAEAEEEHRAAVARLAEAEEKLTKAKKGKAKKAAEEVKQRQASGRQGRGRGMDRQQGREAAGRAGEVMKEPAFQPERALALYSGQSQIAWLRESSVGYRVFDLAGELIAVTTTLQAAVGAAMDEVINHAVLKELAKELGRPLYTLEVLKVDPFTADAPGRRAGAEWFAGLWDRLGGASHIHGFHYLLVSQETPIVMPNGRNYENTEDDEDVLLRCSADARYPDLVPAGSFLDRRNDEPIYNDPPEASDGAIGVCEIETAEIDLPELEIPTLGIDAPVIAHAYRLVVVIEKSTMNHFLQPLCERYHADFIYGVGEQSITRCVQLVERAKAHGLPVRILYISDFDPGGRSMPVAFARKVEHRLYMQEVSNPDIQVRTIALTYEQCIQYRLPRTPLKKGGKRAARFEARLGEGATELDALEAIHPGELERILEQELQRYHDPDLEVGVEDIVKEIRVDLEEITERVHEQHAKAVAKAEAAHEKLQAAIEKYQATVTPILEAIAADLEAETPSTDDFEWPEPVDGDEDDDPLFDSTRSYVEQVDRYKEFQGKPTEGKPRPEHKGEEQTKVCPICNEPFIARKDDTVLCAKKSCRGKYERMDKSDPNNPLWHLSKYTCTCEACGDEFRALRNTAKCCGKLECRTKKGEDQ